MTAAGGSNLSARGAAHSRAGALWSRLQFDRPVQAFQQTTPRVGLLEGRELIFLTVLEIAYGANGVHMSVMGTVVLGFLFWRRRRTRTSHPVLGH